MPTGGFDMGTLRFAAILAACLGAFKLPVAALAAPPQPAELEKPLSVFAFGSCNHQKRPQLHWTAIQAFRPQLWIWGGDNIYADYLKPEDRRAEYVRLKNHPLYQLFLSAVPVIGTWDDHDYGDNNTGKEYSLKRESQREFLAFIDEPKESARWNQEGVHASYVWGPQGKRAKIVLLDVRYFRDEPGADADILGEAQWAWLENALKSDPAEVTFIVSGSQLFPQDHPGDKWAQYPKAYARAVKLFNETPGRIVVLSGDRHIAEISKLKAGEKTIYEFTSSGMTHAYAGPSPNRHRVGPLVRDRNFGVVRIDWSHAPARVRFEIRGVDSKLLHSLDLE